MKTLNKILSTIAIIAGLGLTGCDSVPQATIDMQLENKEFNQKPIYSVKRVGVFADNLAYMGKRGIYEITDEKNNKKYLGVSGIGIIERGVVQSEHFRMDFER